MQKVLTRQSLEVPFKQGRGGRKDTFFFPELPNSSPFIPKLATDSRKPCHIARSSLSTDSPSLAF